MEPFSTLGDIADELLLEPLWQSLELLPDAALIADRQGSLRWCNQMLASWFGADRGARAPLQPREWLAESSVATLREALTTPACAERELELELGGAACGRWVTARLRRLPSGSDLGEESGWLLTLRDCTRARSLLEELDTELRRLRMAVSTRGIGIYEHDHVTDEIYACDIVRSHYGLDASQRLSIADFARATHPHDGEFLLGEIGKAHDPRGDGDFNVLHRILIPSGETRWLHTRATTFFSESADAQRAPARTVGSCIEITREHENELQTRRLAAILDASPDVVATTHLDGRLTYLNLAGRCLLGLDAKAALGDWHVSTLIWEERRAQFEQTVVPNAIARGQWGGEFELRGSDGRPMTVSLVVLALEQPRSDGAYLSIMAHDLSQQKQLEAQLRHAQKLEAVGRLAGGIAHDFNNLLSVVFSFASLVRQHPELPEQARQHTEEILRAGRRAADLTSQLLSFSRKQVLEPRVVCVGRVLKSLLPMIERLVGETIRVKLLLVQEPLRVKVDPGQLELVLINLVVNARDAMPEGGHLDIEAALCQVEEESKPVLELRPGAHVMVRVSDTGCGMSRELQARIFEPFFTTKAAGQGTGLGLSTVFGIVAQSAGGVTVSSEERRGSTFVIYLPVCNDPIHTPLHAPPSLQNARGGAVLVVEDEAQLRSALLALLAGAGYDPIAASGPLEALDLMRQRAGKVDLVLTDIVMPGMRGQELAARLVAEGWTAPVLYMSGYTGGSAAEQDVSTGAVGYLAKPFTAEQLLHKLEQALGSAARGSGAESESLD
ncbi:MAG TPA: ATP-binding protein [Polyangiaceae bacterium]|nr:ATP-binding protein [Polyangiaceae bacterium]